MIVGASDASDFFANDGDPPLAGDARRHAAGKRVSIHRQSASGGYSRTVSSLENQ